MNAKFPGTNFNQKIPVANEIIFAIVFAAIRKECAPYCNCPRLLQFGEQLKVSSRIGGKLRDS